MQTIKTAVVVVLLMVILYGAFVAMNGQETELPPDLENMIAMGGPDFAIEAPPATTTKDTTEPSTLAKSSTPAASPFSMWPSASNPATASSSDKPVETPTELAPAEQADAPELAAASTPSPSLLLPPASGTSDSTVSAPAKPSESTASSSTAPAGTTGSDPWLKTLQNSVATPSTTDPAKTEPPKVPATLTSTSESAVASNPPADSAIKSVNASVSDNKGSSEFSVTSQSFENAKKQALEQIEQGKLKEGLQTLSFFYNSPELTSEQRSDLLDMLDTLAFEVIYSRRHLLDLPYIVAPGESLAQVAQLHEVPVEVLARVNGISEPEKVAPGTKLKVMKGPFRVEVSVTEKEMTLFLGDLYAGRFPVSTGADPEPREGVFQVVDKQRDRNYYGAGGLQIAGTDPRNPYGGFWLDLGQQLSIHGTPVNATADTEKLGCISLSPIDAEDIFTMLSRGSQVTIKR